MRHALFVLLFTLPALAAAQSGLQVSERADRSAATALEGRAFDRNASIYVFVEGPPGITRVRFYLDDPAMSRLPPATERLPPWDLAGGNAKAATPFFLTALADGTHTITAAVERGTSGVEIVSASFTVATLAATAARAPTSLAFPASPDHAAEDHGVAILDHYELRCYQAGAVQAFHVADLGKPAPGRDGTIHVSPARQFVPLPAGVAYTIRIAAVGPHGASLSEPTATIGYGISVPRPTTTRAAPWHEWP